MTWMREPTSPVNDKKGKALHCQGGSPDEQAKAPVLPEAVNFLGQAKTVMPEGQASHGPAAHVVAGSLAGGGCLQASAGAVQC